MSLSRTFFIVDDDSDDQELFIEAVREVDNSIRCISASSCEDAILWLKAGSIDRPDLIFLDLNMPKVSGKQCLAELKRTDGLKNIPVIIYSTSSESKDAEETNRLGASHFLTKPDRFDELCKMLRAVIATDWQAVADANE